jgi:hypothetical protein
METKMRANAAMFSLNRSESLTFRLEELPGKTEIINY